MVVIEWNMDRLIVDGFIFMHVHCRSNWSGKLHFHFSENVGEVLTSYSHENAGIANKLDGHISSCGCSFETQHVYCFPTVRTLLMKR